MAAVILNSIKTQFPRQNCFYFYGRERHEAYRPGCTISILYQLGVRTAAASIANSMPEGVNLGTAVHAHYLKYSPCAFTAKGTFHVVCRPPTCEPHFRCALSSLLGVCFLLSGALDLNDAVAERSQCTMAYFGFTSVGKCCAVPNTIEIATVASEPFDAFAMTQTAQGTVPYIATWNRSL